MFRLNYCLEHLFRQQESTQRASVHLFQHPKHRKTPMGVKDDLRQRFAELSPALQQVAQVRARPPQRRGDRVRCAPSAQRAQSTPATLVRFAQHLGYAGWPQLKEAVAVDMGLGPPRPTASGPRQLVGRAKRPRTWSSEMFEMQRRNLEATRAPERRRRCSKACALLEKAGSVHAAGFRACFPVAFSFVYVYRMFRTSVHLIDGQGGSLEMQQRAMAKGDALVVISFAPYSREALQVARGGQGGRLQDRGHHRQRGLAAVAAGGRDAAVRDPQPVVLSVGRGRVGGDGGAAGTAGQPRRQGRWSSASTRPRRSCSSPGAYLQPPRRAAPESGLGHRGRRDRLRAPAPSTRPASRRPAPGSAPPPRSGG